MIDEREIISLLSSKPEEGLEVLMDEFMSFVYSIASGKLRRICKKQDIEECVSDIFFEVFRKRADIDLEKGSLRAYLAVLAKRRAIDLYRKKANKSYEVSLDQQEYEWAAADFDVEKTIVDAEVGERLISAIKSLGEPDSTIIIQKYYFGQSAINISRQLGIKANTINKKASRALVKLKIALGGAI